MRTYLRLSLFISAIMCISILLGTSPVRSDSYKIYFESDRDGDPCIFEYTAGEPVPVTEVGCTHPSVTADGSMLLYTRIEETLWGRFWNVFYLVDGVEYKLSTNEIYDEMEPVISRDGTFAAYTTMRAYNLEIITLSLNANDLQYRVTENETPDEMPALGTGDEWVYWTGRTGVNSYIVRAPGHGGPVQRITVDAIAWEEHPSVTADGRYIAYSAVTRSEAAEEEAVEEENAGEADSSIDRELLASASKYPWMGGDTTPEEEEVLSEEEEEEEMEESGSLGPEPMEGNSDIWILDQLTGERTRLTTDEAWDGHPCISADGMVIVFTSDRDGNYEIYRMNSDGSGLTRLTDNEAADDFASIT